jgi:hypothetical protein
LNSILREQATTRLRADDFLTKVVGGQSQVIVAEFWEISDGPVSTDVTVAQAQDPQQQQAAAATVTPVNVAQAQTKQQQQGSAATSIPLTIAQAQDPQQQDADAVTGIAAAVAQAQDLQQQDGDAEARDPVTSTDVEVDQAQKKQEQVAQAEATTPAAASYGGGYYSSRILPDTQRRREIKKARTKKPHGLTWPEKWPETTPEILPPLRVTTHCTVEQAQARQEQGAAAKTARGWEPFDFQPEAFSPEAIRIQPPPAPRKAPAWPAASSPIRRPAAVSRVTGMAPGGGLSKRTTEEEELLVVIAISD